MNEKHTGDFSVAGRIWRIHRRVSQGRTHTIAYIRSQAQPHRERSFEEEFLAFLKKHGVEYDPQYVWG